LHKIAEVHFRHFNNVLDENCSLFYGIDNGITVITHKKNFITHSPIFITQTPL
jgi:hypothetical protein